MALSIQLLSSINSNISYWLKNHRGRMIDVVTLLEICKLGDYNREVGTCRLNPSGQKLSNSAINKNKPYEIFIWNSRAKNIWVWVKSILSGFWILMEMTNLTKQSLFGFPLRLNESSLTHEVETISFSIMVIKIGCHCHIHKIIWKIKSGALSSGAISCNILEVSQMRKL